MGGPGRKYYTLTDSGRAELEHQAQAWGEFAGRVASGLGAEVAR